MVLVKMEKVSTVVTPFSMKIDTVCCGLGALIRVEDE